MTQSQEHELHVLNELIVAILDSADDRLLTDAFSHQPDRLHDVGDFFARRLEVVDCLHTQVRALDGTPASEDSILSATYTAMRSSARSDKPALLLGDAIDDTAELLEHRFVAALSDPHLSPPVRETIKAVCSKIRIPN